MANGKSKEEPHRNCTLFYLYLYTGQEESWWIRYILLAGNRAIPAICIIFLPTGTLLFKFCHQKYIYYQCSYITLIASLSTYISNCHSNTKLITASIPPWRKAFQEWRNSLVHKQVQLEVGGHYNATNMMLTHQWILQTTKTGDFQRTCRRDTYYYQKQSTIGNRHHHLNQIWIRPTCNKYIKHQCDAFLMPISNIGGQPVPPWRQGYTCFKFLQRPRRGSSATWSVKRLEESFLHPLEIQSTSRGNLTQNMDIINSNIPYPLHHTPEVLGLGDL